MCSPHGVTHCVPNEIDYGQINVETNSGTAVSTRTTLLTWRHYETLMFLSSMLTLKRFHTFS